METASVEPASQFHSPPGARARSTNIGAGEGSRRAEGGGRTGISLSPPSAPCPVVSAPTCMTLKRVHGHPAVLLSATLCTVTMPVTTGCISTGQKSCGWNQSRPLSQLPRSLPMPHTSSSVPLLEPHILPLHTPHLFYGIRQAQGDQHVGVMLPHQFPELLRSGRASQHHVVPTARPTLQITACWFPGIKVSPDRPTACSCCGRPQDPDIPPPPDPPP